MARRSEQREGKASSTATEVSAVPPIAEKVRFWQEQDRINKAMIPRVVQLSEQVGHLASRLDAYETGQQTAVWRFATALESRLDEQERRLQELQGKLGSTDPDNSLARLVWVAIVLASLALLGIAYVLFRLAA